MKIIVTHTSPDLDAIASVWLIRRFLTGWEEAITQFVPAGERIQSSVIGHRFSDFGQSVNQLTGKQRTGKPESENRKPETDNGNPIEKIGEDEIVHVDTGLGPLDHHQTSDTSVSAASLTWNFVKIQSQEFRIQNDKVKTRIEAIERIVRVVVDIDHFREVFWEDILSDYHEFSLVNILDGLKLQKPDNDDYYVDFISKCFDALVHELENRIWAEKEIAKNGKKFNTRFGKGIGLETINDSVLKLAQKMGYAIVVRKDPRKGYVRVKARPSETQNEKRKTKNDIDLTLPYEKLKKMDPTATWFLHISKKMLLNGTVKNPKMRPTKLSLDDIIEVLKEI